MEVESNLHGNKFENVCFQRAAVADKIVHSNHVLHSRQHFLHLKDLEMS